MTRPPVDPPPILWDTAHVGKPVIYGKSRLFQQDISTPSFEKLERRWYIYVGLIFCVMER